MAKKAKKETTGGATDLVEKIVGDFNSSWTYRASSWHTIWSNMQKLYDSERVYVGYNGISDTFVPMSYSTIETMVAATSGEKPMVEYVATRPDQETNTEVLNGLWSYYWDLDGWTPKLIQHTRTLFKFGTSVLRAYWNIDHPCIDIIPLRDYFCDPTATFFGYKSARFMGHRFLADKGELAKEQVIDPETGELVPKYKNLDKLGDSFESGDNTAKQEKDIDMGSTLEGDAKNNQIEVICYETLDEVIYIGNRQEIIYQNDNYFKQRQQFLGIENPTGMFSYMVDAFSPDESQLYGKSVLQPIAKHQELLNDLTNQNIDAVSWSIDPEMELDPQYSAYIGKMKSATGNVYPFKPGSYSAVQKPLLPTNVFNERTNIKNEIREATAIDEVIKGIRGGNDTTATEVKAQVASSGRRFDLIITTLENGGYYQLAKLVFQMVQLYVTTPVMFRVVGEKGVDWQTFDPEQFKGDYEPRIKLKATLDQENKMKMRDLKEFYTAMLGNPFIDQPALTRLITQKAFKLDMSDVDTLVKKQDQVAQEAQDAGKKPDKTPEQIALEGIAKDYANADPDTKAQLEQMAGLDPSATHEGAMETMAAQQMAEQATFGETMAPMPDQAPTPVTTQQAPQMQPMGAPDGS